MACRDAAGGWRLAFLVPDGAATGPGYAPAGEEASLADGLAERMRAGDPLTEEQERDLIGSRWR